MTDAQTLTRREHITVLTRLLKLVIQQIKGLHAELRAYETVFAGLKVTLPQYARSLDELLAAARRSPVLQEKLRQEYDIPLERFLALDTQSQTEDEIWKLFPNNATDLIQ